jgi:hypothetical protein
VRQLPQRRPYAVHLRLGRIGWNGDVVVFVDPQQFLHSSANLRIGIQEVLPVPPVLVPQDDVHQGIDQHFPLVEIIRSGIEKLFGPLLPAGGQHELPPTRR